MGGVRRAALTTVPSLCVVLPGPVDTATGGYRYDRQMIAELRALQWHVDVRELPARFPFPDDAARDAARALFAQLPDGAVTLVDGLAYGVLGDVVAPHAARLRLAALVHHPLHAETGLDPSQQRRLFDAERRALSMARRVFVTSEATSALMQAAGLVTVAPCVVVPGTTRAPLRPRREDPHTRLLCVATLTPRKAHALLLDSLATLRALPWTLTCVGSTRMHPPTTAALERQIAALGLVDRVRLHGECEPDELRALHLESDVFVLASAFEGYGMAVAEALAQGLPVVASRTGAAASLVGDAGLLVDPGDGAALTGALRQLLADVGRREAFAARARARSAMLPRWEESAAQMAGELARLVQP